MSNNDQLSFRLVGFRRHDGKPRVIKLKEVHSGLRITSTQPLWRYLSIAKFVSLLSSQSLWFSRLDLLGDSFEGAATRNEVVSRQAHTDREAFERVWRSGRQWWVVNCWHMSTHESEAMWQLYSTRGEGVAIRTTVGVLTECLQNSVRHFGDADVGQQVSLQGFFIGNVHYVDFTRAIVEHGSPVGKYFLKRLAFRHEAEVRVLAPLPQLTDEKGVDADALPPWQGVSVPVDLSALVGEVLVSPTAPPWYKNVIASLVNRYEITATVRVSSLDDAPDY